MKSTVKRGTIPLVALLCFLLGQAFAQTTVRGKVTEGDTGSPLPGVTVLAKGTQAGVITDFDGNYTIAVPAGATTLVFSYVGFVTQEIEIGSQTTIDLGMTADVRALQEVVVTGYTTQEKKDIIGSVSVVNTKDLLITPAGNVQQQLQGRAAGVTVSGSGQPGAGAKVRIRGFGSFGSSDPLYIIDGVPTQSVVNINPQDIESLQVLKDAAASSIYGSRAANGVVIITTRQGKAGQAKIMVDSYYGVQNVTKTYDLLNTQEYGELLWQGFRNAGVAPQHPIYGNGANPTIPDFLVAGTAVGVMAGHPSTNPDLYNVDYARGGIHQITPSNRQGTNWYDEILRTAPIQSHQVTATGGSEKGTYSLGLNYFDQAGTLIHTGYRRYTARANSNFLVKKNIRVGENIQISYEDRLGGTNNGEGAGDNIGEGGAFAQAYRMPPIVPVRDAFGNFAGTRGAGLGNGSNPVADLDRRKDNKNETYRIFGNAYAEADFLKHFTARTSFGIDFLTRNQRAFFPRTFERAENTAANSFAERNDWSMNWTFSNTLVFDHKIGDHTIKALAGTEAIKNQGRGVGGSRNNFFSSNPDFWVLDRGDPRPGESFSYGFRDALFSVFGRVDYIYKDKYLFNATVRRDGSSRFGPESRYGNFPALGAGWRLSQEDFMAGLDWVDDLKLRGSWGKMGNQLNVNAANQYSFYRSTPGNSSYDIRGTNNSVVFGYDLDRIGNLRTRWETTTTTNIGLDATLFNGTFDVSVEWYNRFTSDLLVGQQVIFTGVDANLPAINVGDMKNTGIDLMLTKRGKITTDLTFETTLTLSHYRNEVVRLAESDDAFFTGGGSRFGNLTRTQKGQPISSFYGYTIDGFFQTDEEVANARPQPIPPAVGRWRLVDTNGDGRVNVDDLAPIGNPHPLFQMGLNLSLAYKGFDFTTFLFWNYGNDIFHYNRWWIDFNSFQGGRSNRMLYDSWRPDNRNASLPIIDAFDTFSGNLSTDYYIESGSFLRARTMQVGYTLPKTTVAKVGLDNLRVYLQAQNLFTVTKYTGLDPDMAIQQADLGMGIDRGIFPNARQIIGGLTLSF